MMKWYLSRVTHRLSYTQLHLPGKRVELKELNGSESRFFTIGSQGLLCRMLSYVMVRAQAATQSTTVLPDPSGFHHYPLRCAQREGGFSSKMQGSPCSFQLCRKHWKKQPTIRCGDKKQGCKRAPRIREEQPNDLALSGWADSCFLQALPPHWASSST